MLQCERFAASLTAGACGAKECCNAPCAGSMAPTSLATALIAARCCRLAENAPGGSNYTLLTPFT